LENLINKDIYSRTVGGMVLQRLGISFLLKCNLFFFFFFFITQFIAGPAWSKDNLVIPGVFWLDYQFGRKSQAEVMAILDIEDAKIKKQTVICHLPNESQEINTSYGELGIRVDRDKIWLEASSVGRTGRWWQRLWTRWQVSRKGYQIPLYLKIDRNTAELKLKNLTRPWYIAPKDARLVIKPDDKAEIIPHEMGREVDCKAALTELERVINTEPGKSIYLSLAYRDLKPGKLKSDLENYNIKGLISRFSTQFNQQRINRTENIKLAAQALDYCFIAPGEVFSFNRAVGPRTRELGYNEADIILQNELVPGIGGGVCQVSTTLYNVVLRAELEVIERHPHSMTIPYVEPGLDATVVYEGKDFKFRNNTEGYLVLKTSVSGGNLSIKIFGRPDEKKRVYIKSQVEREIQPKTIYRDDPLVPKGQYVLEREGEPGCVVRVERHVYDEKGKWVRTDFISRDHYPPVDRVIKTCTDSSLLLPPG